MAKRKKNEAPKSEKTVKADKKGGADKKKRVEDRAAPATETQDNLREVFPEDQTVYEPLVYRLAFLNKAMTETQLQIALQTRVYDERLAVLNRDRQAVLTHWKNMGRSISEDIGVLRREIEEKHGLDLDICVYDDVLGTIMESEDLREARDAAREKTAVPNSSGNGKDNGEDNGEDNRASTDSPPNVNAQKLH